MHVLIYQRTLSICYFCQKQKLGTHYEIHVLIKHSSLFKQHFDNEVFRS